MWLKNHLIAARIDDFYTQVQNMITSQIEVCGHEGLILLLLGETSFIACYQDLRHCPRRLCPSPNPHWNHPEPLLMVPLSSAVVLSHSRAPRIVVGFPLSVRPLTKAKYAEATEH